MVVCLKSFIPESGPSSDGRGDQHSVVHRMSKEEPSAYIVPFH